MEKMRVGVIGGGQMGTALVKGLVNAGVTSPEIVTVAEIQEQARKRLETEVGVRTTPDAAVVVKGADLVIVALKPQVASGALGRLAGVIEKKQTVLSIMAGVKASAIEHLLGGDVPVVRAMPNAPALVGAGVAAICPGTNAAEEDLARAERALSAVGGVVRVSEAQMDAVTGLSGSGPGYVYTVIEALADGGVKMGLAKPLALELAARTVLGAARMVLETGEHPAALRDRVTSPGGTTIAGIHAMERAGLRSSLMDAVEAATRRSEELGR